MKKLILISLLCILCMTSLFAQMPSPQVTTIKAVSFELNRVNITTPIGQFRFYYNDEFTLSQTKALQAQALYALAMNFRVTFYFTTEPYLSGYEYQIVGINLYK